MTKQKTTIGILQFLLGSQGETAVTAAYSNGLQTPPATRQTAVSRPSKPTAPAVIKNPSYSEVQTMQLVSMLAGLMENGVRKFDVVEQYGHVFVIRYELLAKPDPVLPFVFRDYGRRYRRSYQQLTNKIALFNMWGGGGWDYKAARRIADTLINCVASDRSMTHAEVDYYQTRLMYAIAMPQNHR